MVYETVEASPTQWEYYVLKIDASEEPLPEADRFNELGRDGWILAGMLDERASGKGKMVYYYFVRRSYGDK
jgi:hypothetical protein